MAYEPTTWNSGDLITAEKLNKLEQGVKNEQVGPAGETGARGPAGAAAGFGTPTATVDANTGTPSVAVTASGPDTAKVFNFAFKNLKGAPVSDSDGNGTRYGKGLQLCLQKLKGRNRSARASWGDIYVASCNHISSRRGKNGGCGRRRSRSTYERGIQRPACGVEGCWDNIDVVR